MVYFYHIVDAILIHCLAVVDLRPFASYHAQDPAYHNGCFRSNLPKADASNSLFALADNKTCY